MGLTNSARGFAPHSSGTTARSGSDAQNARADRDRLLKNVGADRLRYPAEGGVRLTSRADLPVEQRLSLVLEPQPMPPQLPGLVRAGRGHGSSGLTQRVEEGKRACSRANLFGGLHCSSNCCMAAAYVRLRAPGAAARRGGAALVIRSRDHTFAGAVGIDLPCCVGRGSPGFTARDWTSPAAHDPMSPFPQSDRLTGKRYRPPSVTGAR